MKVYVESYSKASLNRRLAVRERVTAVHHSLTGPVIFPNLRDLDDGTTVAVYERTVRGQPIAKSWGTLATTKTGERVIR